MDAEPDGVCDPECDVDDGRHGSGNSIGMEGNVQCGADSISLICSLDKIGFSTKS
jgi:hypothetical protein